MNVGEAIKKLRQKNGLEQKQLADYLGVSNKTISSWEHNRTQPKMEMIERMCAIFNCSKSDFFDFDNQFEVEFQIPSDDKSIKLILEVPERKHALFTTLNKRAEKLSDSDLKKAIEMMRLLSEEEQDQ